MTEKTFSNSTAFSSKRQDWETPQKFFEILDNEFNFTLDAAASKKNTKCRQYFTELDNSLLQEWHGRVFCNPPYGKDIQWFIEKAARESQMDYCELVVLLIPARTDTRYWHNHIFNVADDIRFLKGRLKFEINGIAKDSAPFPSAIIVYRNTEFLKGETV